MTSSSKPVSDPPADGVIEALKKISAMKYEDRSTVSEATAWPHFQRLHRQVYAMFDIADAAIEAYERARGDAPSDEHAALGALVAAVASRYGTYYQRSMTFADDDESPLMFRVCEQRDNLMVALRSLNRERMAAAMADSAVVGAEPIPASKARA